MTGEQDSIVFGSSKIEYFIRRSPRRKTISIFVDPYDGVFLRAPYDPSLNTISRLVRSKATWILKKQKQIEAEKEFLPDREFVSGETYLYLGRQYCLKRKAVSTGAKTVARLKDGYFFVEIDGNLMENVKKEEIRKCLTHWYHIHAKGVLVSRIKTYSKKTNLMPANLLLADQSKRWGSCNKNGELRINWRIVMAPVSLIDYVLVHEMCHIKHANHSPDFWKLLGSIMPDYEFRRERLRKEGARYYL